MCQWWTGPDGIRQGHRVRSQVQGQSQLLQAVSAHVAANSQHKSGCRNRCSHYGQQSPIGAAKIVGFGAVAGAGLGAVFPTIVQAVKLFTGSY